VLGIVMGLGARHALSDQAVHIAGVGFCGAYTTFSTFSYELVHVREKGQVRKPLLYGASSLVVGLSAAAAGLAIGSF
jgi:CrcB protein